MKVALLGGEPAGVLFAKLRPVPPAPTAYRG